MLSGKLDIVALGGKSLDDVRLMTSMSPALVIEWDKKKFATEPHKSGGTKPKWNHTFAPIYLGAVSPQAPILFAVTDGGKETVGLLTMQIAQFLAMIDHANKLVGGDKQVHLAMRRKDGTEKGDVYLSCTWTPAPQPAPVQPQPITPLQPMPASAPRTSNAPLPQQMQQPMMQQQPQPMSMQPMQPMMQPQPMPYAMPAQHPQMVQQSYMPPVGTVLMTQPVPITVQGGYAPIPQQPMHPMQQPYTQPAYYPPPQQPLQMSPQGYYPQPPNQMPMSAPAQPMHAVSPSWQPAPSADEGVFQFSELKITRLIGEGMFGTVSAGEFRSTPVAVKQLKQLQFSPAQHQEFMDETKFLREARHPNIVLFMGVCFQPPCLVTELLDTSLFAVLHTDRIQLSQKQKVHIALGVARGVASLHGHAVPIVHRDLKSLNVLVSNDFKQGGVGLVKICDLGMVKTKAAQGQRLDASGTPNWMAPEVLMNQPYDEQADVYSFGCVLYELLSGTVPYAGAEFTRDRIAERVGKGDRPALPKGLQKGWQDLIVGCWQHHPRSRPTMAKVVEMIQAIPTE